MDSNRTRGSKPASEPVRLRIRWQRPVLEGAGVGTQPRQRQHQYPGGQEVPEGGLHQPQFQRHRARSLQLLDTPGLTTRQVDKFSEDLGLDVFPRTRSHGIGPNVSSAQTQQCHGFTMGQGVQPQPDRRASIPTVQASSEEGRSLLHKQPPMLSSPAWMSRKPLHAAASVRIPTRMGDQTPRPDSSRIPLGSLCANPGPESRGTCCGRRDGSSDRISHSTVARKTRPYQVTCPNRGGQGEGPARRTMR